MKPPETLGKFHQNGTTTRWKKLTDSDRKVVETLLDAALKYKPKPQEIIALSLLITAFLRVLSDGGYEITIKKKRRLKR